MPSRDTSSDEAIYTAFEFRKKVLISTIVLYHSRKIEKRDYNPERVKLINSSYQFAIQEMSHTHLKNNILCKQALYIQFRNTFLTIIYELYNKAVS